MDRIKIENIRNTNCAFLTSIPWYIMGNIYGETSSGFAKGLGIYELERIIYSALLYDKLVINTYIMSGDAFKLSDPISNVLIEDGVLVSLDGEFVNSTDFVEKSLKEGSYGGLSIGEILKVLGENSLRELIFSRLYELSIEKWNDTSKDFDKYFEPFDIHIKKLKFINHLGADNNIPLIAGNFEDGLLSVDQNLGTILLNELIEKKYNQKELNDLTNKIKKLKILRLTNHEFIKLPPLLSEVVKNSKGKIGNFPIELIKLRNQKEFKKIRKLLNEVQLRPGDWSAEKIAFKFNDIIKINSDKSKQILERVISIPLALIPTANESLSLIKILFQEWFSDKNIALSEKFNLRKSFTIKSNLHETNKLVKDIINEQLFGILNKNKLLFNRKIKTLHNMRYDQ